MLFSKVVYRKLDVINSMAVSLLIILADNPFSIKDIGLQLSYLGTLGIVYLNKPIENFLKRYTNEKLAQILSITISAQIMILPITVLNFNTISTVFMLSNIIAAPLAGSIVLVGYVNIFIAMVSIKIGKMIAIFTHSLVQMLIWVAKLTAKIPFSTITVTTPSIITIILYYIAIYFLFNKITNPLKAIKILKCILEKSFKKKSILKIVSIFIVIIIILFNIIKQPLEVHFVDVGQRRLYCNKNSIGKNSCNRYRRTRKNNSGIFIR